jgi:hypothetical protein
MNALKLMFHHDPGHGWIAVKRHLLITLGIADKITGYSYQKGLTVYCEEDCDASLLLKTLDERGIKWAIEESQSRPDYSPIRSYDRYEYNQ